MLFINALKNNKAVAFSKIIDKFPQLLNKKYEGKTLAHKAVLFGNFLAVQLLAEKSPNIFNDADDEGFLPLYFSKDYMMAKDVLSHTSKEAIQTCTDKLSLIHQAISDENKELLQALVEDKSGKVDLGLNCNGQLPIAYIFVVPNIDNDNIEPFITALSKEQINQKDANGNTALFKAAAYDAEKIPLLAKNPHLEVTIEDVIIALNNGSNYGFSVINNPLNAQHINYLNLKIQRENNKTNRDKAIKNLLATNKLTDDMKNKAALKAANNHDIDSLKALINAGADSFAETNINSSIKANALVHNAVSVAMSAWACNVAQKTIDYDNAESFKNLVAKKTNNTLQALKEAGLPKEAFSKGILKYDNGNDINWTNVAYVETFTNTVIWYFKEVQDKLKELSELD